MKIGILQCDETREELRPLHGNYPDMFFRLLRPLREGLTFEVYRVQALEYPETPDECDGYIITGSKHSVYEDEPWVRTLAEQVRHLYQAKAPLLGICFGHQMIAHALGGKTEKATQGWGVGVQTYQVSQHDTWMSPDLDTFSIVASHQDQVTQLPPDAELMGHNAFCPHAMFRIGKQVLAFQGHPEFEKAYSLDLMKLREELLGAEVFAEGVRSLEKPLQSWEVGTWMLNFLQEASGR